MSKLPNLELQQSPRSINKTQLKFDLALQGQSEKLIRQPLFPQTQRRRSTTKQHLLKKQLQSVTVSQVNEEAQSKKPFQNEKKYQDQIQTLELIAQSWESKYYEKQSQCEALNVQLTKANNQIEEFILQINNLKMQNQELKQQIESSISHKQCLLNYQDLKMQYRRLDEVFRKALDDNYASQQKVKNIELKAENLETLANSLKIHVNCKYCNKLLQNAITIIPCAHSFCSKCITGYLGQCFICKDKSKVQATYINDYMNDLAKMQQMFEQIIQILRD